ASERKPMYMASLGLSKTLLNGDGTLTMNVQDIFNTGGFKRKSINPTFITESEMKWSPRQFNISFTYRFRQGDKVDQPKKPRRDMENGMGEDDMPPM
ncbi:MAG: TonB-dependent receptor, partial [Chryseobacterium sp.]